MAWQTQIIPVVAAAAAAAAAAVLLRWLPLLFVPFAFNLVKKNVVKPFQFVKCVCPFPNRIAFNATIVVLFFNSNLVRASRSRNSNVNHICEQAI